MEQIAVPMSKNDGDQSTEGWVEKGLALSQQCADHCLVVTVQGLPNNRMIGLCGLDNDRSLFVPSSGATSHLDDQLESPFAGSEIRI